MKKYLLSFALILCGLTAFAQTSYEKIMAEKIAKIETCKSGEEFQALANDFQRISEKEKDKWQPFYYVAFSFIQKGRLQMREGKTQDLDVPADQAMKFLVAAESISDNSEIHLLKKMVYSLKMMVNPMERYMTDGAKAAAELATAEKLDPTNPRVALIKAEDTYFTPEQYGGSKTKGIEQFKDAMVKFKAFTPKTAIDPNWGEKEAEYIINQSAK